MKYSLRNIVFVVLFVLLIFSCKKEPTSPTYTGWTNYNTSNSGLVSNEIWGSMAIDSLDNKWFGTITDGISKFDGNKWTTYAVAGGYYINTVWDIKVDTHDTIWGTSDAGLMKFDGTNWNAYNTANGGLPSGVGGQIGFDLQGNMWVGASKFNGNIWTIYNSTNSGIVYNGIGYLCTSIDAQGNIWFGTWGSGVSKFSGNNWSTYNTKNGLINDSVNAIAFDKHGNTWFGTCNGLSKFDGSNWTNFNTMNSGLANNWVWCIAVDIQDNIWLGYGSVAGITKFDGNKWITYNTSNSGLSNNEVVTIAIDKQGNKWIGTGTGGVCEFKD